MGNVAEAEVLESTLREPQLVDHVTTNAKKSASRHNLVQVSREDTIAVIGGILEARYPEHGAPVLLSHGSDRAVFGWVKDGKNIEDVDMVAKVSLAPSVTSEEHPWRHERAMEYQDKLRAYFPKEWLLPEHHHKIILSKKNGKTWVLITDFQKRLGAVYHDHSSAPSWCYRCPERGDHREGKYSVNGDQESDNSNSLTVRNVAPEPHTSVSWGTDEERSQYIRVTQDLLQKPSGILFNEQEFLSVQRSPYIKDIFKRMDTDQLFRDKTSEFIDATTIFSSETDEILDGMGRGNILFRADMAWDPLFVDVRPPDPPRMLKLARSIFQNYAKIAHKDDQDRWRKLQVPLIVIGNTINNIRTLNACRRKLGMDPSEDIALSDGLIEHLGQMFDDMRHAFP